MYGECLFQLYLYYQERIQKIDFGFGDFGFGGGDFGFGGFEFGGFWISRVLDFEGFGFGGFPVEFWHKYFNAVLGYFKIGGVEPG